MKILFQDTNTSRSSDGIPVAKKDIVGCVFFLLFWIIPVFYTGLTHHKILFFPRYVTYFQNIGNLFTHAVPVWPMPYIQVQLAGDPTWRTLAEEDFFRLWTFGYRTRFFEAVYYGTNIPDYERKSSQTQVELARWVARRYERLHPGSPAPEKIRFVAGLYYVQKDHPPSGHWRLPPVESFPADHIYVLSTHDVR